jgi:hypothetical protein
MGHNNLPSVTKIEHLRIPQKRKNRFQEIWRCLNHLTQANFDPGYTTNIVDNNRGYYGGRLVQTLLELVKVFTT